MLKSVENSKLDKKSRLNFFLDSLGLYLIGIFSLGYVLFVRKFAELHIQLSFLDFPIFVGEILLFLCLVLLIIKWMNQRKKLNAWHYCLFVYGIFFLAKALWGYSKWGPLAFRHAALFYYLLFAIFGYSFYRRKFFSDKKSIFLFLSIIYILRSFAYGVTENSFFEVIYFPQFMKSNGAFLIACFSLAIIFIKSHSDKVTKYILFTLLLIASPYMMFLYDIPRAMAIANVASGIYYLIAFSFILRIKKLYKLTIFVIFAMVLLAAVAGKLKDRTIRPLLNFKQCIESYKSYDKIITERVNSDEWINIVARANKSYKRFKHAELYNPESKRDKIIPPSSGKTTKIESALPSSDIDNVFFRLFIWRDMLRELKDQKPIFGFDFGKPLRSESIEFLYWSTGEWARDGWITSHNSYFEIIYRAGILGFLFVAAIFIGLFRMIKKSTKLKSVTGILLCGILINWLVIASSLPILELPYNAIPFWSLFGMTLAYLMEKRRI